ncbi:MAG: hypothetical protein WCI67_06990 [Chloroflexales bacterium]
MSTTSIAPTTPSAAYPTRFSDEQVLRITNLFIDRYERLGLRLLVEEIAGLDQTQIADDTAALISELLTAQGHGPEDDPTFTFLAGIMQPPGPDEDPDWRNDRTLRCVTNAIALGLHVEEDGALLRVLLEDPDEVVPAEFAVVYDEIMRRAVAEIAR